MIQKLKCTNIFRAHWNAEDHLPYMVNNVNGLVSWASVSLLGFCFVEFLVFHIILHLVLAAILPLCIFCF